MYLKIRWAKPKVHKKFFSLVVRTSMIFDRTRLQSLDYRHSTKSTRIHSLLLPRESYEHVLLGWKKHNVQLESRSFCAFLSLDTANQLFDSCSKYILLKIFYKCFNNGHRDGHKISLEKFFKCFELSDFLNFLSLTEF